MERTITVSDTLYRALQREATRRQYTPDALAEEVLTQELLPQHPHVECVTGSGGSRAVIRGTRVGVDVIVGYTRAGYAPETISAELLPQLSQAQVYDALSYAHDHPEALAALEEHSAGAWQARLQARLDPAAYARLTGTSPDA
ncbi:MAG: DUF433 domain-containing protein [Anaerolineae bacterium]|jgi:uncharacterized protein (DUF433 family)|nr:DUF433 domain-containing protein [Anaerolineae bacterium]